MDLSGNGLVARTLRDVATKLMWNKQVKHGHELYDKLQEDVQHAQEVQEGLLFELLRKHADTPFGREQGFADIHSVEDYKKAVAPTTFDDYAGWIYEAMEHGTDGLMSTDPIIHFSETSGTMGNPKGIPYTQATADILLGYGNDYCMYLVSKQFGDLMASGRRFSMLECHLKTLKGGGTFGAMSSKGVHEYRKVIPLMTTSPDEAVFSVAETDTRYLHARFLLEEPDVREMTSVFMSVLLDLMRYIEDNWEMLVRDIEQGTIDPSIAMGDEVRASVSAKVRPNPARAAELRAIFEAGFDEPFMTRVWPNLCFIFTVAGAGFAPYTERMRRYSGNVPVLYTGYSASEGMFSVPFELENPASIMLPRAAYFEFLPLGEDDYSKTVGVEGVEPGRDYEVLVTTRFGFYRYKMRDAVRIVGKRGQMPLMEFLFRIDQTVNMKGEKTTELVLRNVAEKVVARMGLDLVDFSVYPNLDVNPPRYEFLYEFFHAEKTPFTLDELSRVSDEELRAGNADMEDMRADGSFAPTAALMLQPETNLLWRDMRVLKGAAPNQIKPVHVIDTEQKRRFFYALVDQDHE